MPADPTLAVLSDNLLILALLTYTVAMVGYAVEYAFGQRGKVAAVAEGQETVAAPESATVDAPPAAQQRELVGAGASGAPPLFRGSTPFPQQNSVENPEKVSTAKSGPQGMAPGERTSLAGRLAIACTVLGMLAQIGCLAARGLAAHRVPWGNMYEFVSLVCLMGVSAWLVVIVVNRQVRHLGLFVLIPVVLLLGLAGTVLYAEAAPLMPALNSVWLKIHVSAAGTASGIFLIGFVTAMLFLLRQRYERGASEQLRFPLSLAPRLPDAATLERVTFRIHALAFPLWTFAVIAGAIWAEAAWTRYWGWDPKETWAFISWVVYAAYLHARATAGWRGSKSVAIAVVGWGTMMVNLFVINLVTSGLHSYAGVS